MTGQAATPRNPAPRGRAVSRRSLLVGSVIAALGIGGGLGVGAYARSKPDNAENPGLTEGERLGAMVALPVDGSGVARWRADIDTLAEHGQNLVRTGIYAWKVAAEQGRWDPQMVAFFREQLAYARSLGMGINLVVPGAPDWAKSFGFDGYAAACTWFWTQMRQGFGDQVELWQAFNEADHAHYQRFTPATRDAAYLRELAQLLSAARDTLGRDGVPVTTNLTGWPLNDEREQEWYLVLDAIGDSLDVIGIDLYPADNETEIGRLPERMERVRQRYGRPIFVAEIGLQTTPGSWTEPDQQRYLTAAIEQLRAVELWGICLYELRDNQSPAGFGITRADSTKKLGFHDVIHALSPR
jgi:hypothetical protein